MNWWGIKIFGNWIVNVIPYELAISFHSGYRSRTKVHGHTGEPESSSRGATCYPSAACFRMTFEFNVYIFEKRSNFKNGGQATRTEYRVLSTERCISQSGGYNIDVIICTNQNPFRQLTVAKRDECCPLDLKFCPPADCSLGSLGRINAMLRSAPWKLSCFLEINSCIPVKSSFGSSLLSLSD